MGGDVNSSSKKAFNFMFNEEEATIEFITFWAFDRQATVWIEVLGFEFQNGFSEIAEASVVIGARNNNVVSKI